MVNSTLLQKIQVTSLSDGDFLYAVRSPNSNPYDARITFSNLKAAIGTYYVASDAERDAIQALSPTTPKIIIVNSSVSKGGVQVQYNYNSTGNRYWVASVEDV